ncbi:MAG: hypothetical protein ACKO9Z_07625 [Planctomycetota bacterium]
MADCACFQQKLVSQRAFAVIYVGDNGKIPDQPGIGHATASKPVGQTTSNSLPPRAKASPYRLSHDLSLE